MAAQEYEVVSFFVMDYQEYPNTWIPIVAEVLQYQMEPGNNVDKYAVPVMNKDRALEYLMKGKNGKFAETVFSFLRVDVTKSAKLTINGKVVNNGKEMGMEVSCTITFTGTKPMLNKLKEVW